MNGERRENARKPAPAPNLPVRLLPGMAHPISAQAQARPLGEA